MKEVKSLKESFAATEAVNENRIIAVTNASNVETARSLQYLSDEYDDLSASNSRVLSLSKYLTALMYSVPKWNVLLTPLMMPRSTVTSST